MEKIMVYQQAKAVKPAALCLLLGVGCVVASILMGCGDVGSLNKGNLVPCTVTKTGTISTIACPDGTTTSVSDGTAGAVGATGIKGLSGISAGVQITTLDPGATCPAGGLQLVNFQDLNSDGHMQLGEPMIGLSYLCNGVQGIQGIQGATGATCATGATGATGAAGHNGTNGTNGTNGISSTFGITADNGTNCPTGGFDVTFTDSTHSVTKYICNGAAGHNGTNGTNGTNGHDGATGATGATGAQGVAGRDGTNGTNGNNGNSGTNGTNGTNGVNGGTVSFNLVQAIMPCGANSSPWKEVLLGLQGGQILSSFSETASGQNTRFSFIPNGTYQDTDSSGCQFTVTGNGSTTSAIYWSAGSNGYGSWSAGGFNWTSANGWVAQ